jgi:radical SAM protein with 4Fe4S-binding SPASM domain
MDASRPTESPIRIYRNGEDAKVSSILERQKAEPKFRAPTSVDINITNRCDLKCNFCSATPFHHASKKDELSLAELEILFDAIEENGVFLVRIAGGEPLVREDLPQILQLMQRYSFDRVLLTNGLRLSPDICDRLVKARFDSVSISVDSHIPHLHDQARGRDGAHAKTLANLANLRRAGLPFGAMTTVTASNVIHMVEIAAFLQSHGFRSVNFILLNASGLAIDSMSSFAGFGVWSEQFLRLTDWIKHTGPSIDVRILPPHEDSVPYELHIPLRNAGRLDDLRDVWRIHPGASAKREISCTAGQSQMTIYENGDVYGCDLMRDDPRWKAGNVRDQSMMDIWHNSPTFQLLRGMAYSDVEGSCSTCSNHHCGGGCRASAANLTGSLFGSDINCGMHRRDTSPAASD